MCDGPGERCPSPQKRRSPRHRVPPLSRCYRITSVLISYDAPVTPPIDTLLLVTSRRVVDRSVSDRREHVRELRNAGRVRGLHGASVLADGRRLAGDGVYGTAIKTTLHPAIVTGNTVMLTWDPLPAATGYELEVFIVDTGQTFNLPVGNQTSLVVPDVPAGSYVARVRGRNAFGVGPYSDKILVNIGPTIRVRDLEITLTWNTLADIDLHVIEPSGRPCVLGEAKRCDGVS